MSSAATGRPADNGLYEGSLAAPPEDEYHALIQADRNFRGDVVLIRVFLFWNNSKVSIWLICFSKTSNF